jgi:ATP-binding cassette, subfamily B, bacterial PglK
MEVIQLKHLRPSAGIFFRNKPSCWGNKLKTEFGKVWQLLNKKERRQLSMVSGLHTFSGLVDMLGVISIMPFLSVASNSEILQSNTYLQEIKNWVNVSDKQFLILLGVLSLMTLLLNQIVRLGSGWYSQFVSHRIWWNLHNRMFRYYLNQSYMYHLEHSGNALLEKLQVRINAVVAGVIQPYFLILSSLFSTLFTISLLFWIEPLMTVTLLGIITLFYLLIFQKLKSRLSFYGKISPEFSQKSFKLINEAFGAIKEIKVRRNEQIYLDLFDPLAKRYCDSQVKIQLYGAVPSGLVEVVAFGGILLISLFMINETGGFQKAVPILGMYALALRRILPAVQDIYRQIAQIRFYQPSMDDIQEDLTNALTSTKDSNTKLFQVEHIQIKEKIEIKKMCFKFPRSSQKVLDSISMRIPVGSLIGIAGGSGAGKTTLVDIILGLFEPLSGNILIDGEPLSLKNIHEWQSSLGYVPQAGFIADGNISSNIAFGIPEVEVDMKRVREMAKIAHISEFIEQDLPHQYETLVGERGIRLSGGQRQRLGIARALYFDPKILILDEATSALDGITEEKVMSSIYKLLGQKTILLIAHRLTTLQECNTIYLLENGKIIDQGNYQSLIKNNSIFQRMARVNNQII